MTDRTQDQGTPAPSGAASTGARRWVVPAALFAAGLLLGGGAVALTNANDSESDSVAAPVASPSPSLEPSPSPADPAELRLRIPAPCVQVAKEADAAFKDVDQLAEAVRGFDARALQQFLERFQEVRPRIEALSQDCQDRAATGVVEGDVNAPTPAPEPAPSTGPSTAPPAGPSTAPSPVAS